MTMPRTHAASFPPRRLASLLLLLPALVFAQAPTESERTITLLAGDVYRFQSGGRCGVFMVTDEGIVVADPISDDTATWLDGELRKRFNQPVKYVLYSHDHWDHVSGAEVFADATIVAHANAVPHIAASDRGIVPPDLTFSSELELKLGGKRVHLYYLGVSHSDNLVHMVFPDERVLFAVDAVAVNRLPFQDFPGTDIDGLIGALSALEQMDVAIVAPGHGAVGTLDDVRAHREYIEKLKDQVTGLLRVGNSDAAIKRAVNLDEYRSWESYDAWHDANIDGMIAYVKSNYRF
jgi:glyoxylase-like metal-dependent hydrolase (beta-lactamase superfamily II)